MKETYHSSDPLSVYCKEIRDAAPILGLTATDIEALLERRRKRKMMEANSKKAAIKKKIAKGNKNNHLALIFIRQMPQYL